MGGMEGLKKFMTMEILLGANAQGINLRKI
jgi:hypothetical protein